MHFQNHLLPPFPFPSSFLQKRTWRWEGEVALPRNRLPPSLSDVLDRCPCSPSHAEGMIRPCAFKQIIILSDAL